MSVTTRVEGAVPLRELPSACPTVGYRAADRLDPYYSPVSHAGYGGVQASWVGRAVSRRLERDGFGGAQHMDLRYSEREALELCLGTHRERRLRHLGSTNMWRTVSEQHLAALTGDRRVAELPTRSDSNYWSAAGFEQVGSFVAARGIADWPRLARPAPSPRMLDALRDRLSWDEWVGLCAWRPWQTGTQQLRHNLLATELSLRVAEWCDVGAVLGESHARLAEFVDTQAGLGESKKAADAVWLRRDGLTVAVEMTAGGAAGPAFQGKVSRWADALAADKSRSTVVLFVEATRPDRGRRDDFYDAVGKACRESMDHVVNDVPARVAFAFWEDLFPAPSMATKDLRSFPVRRPSGPEGARWESASLFNRDDFPMTPAEEREAAVGRAALLYGCPPWLASRSDTQAVRSELEDRLLAEAGLAVTGRTPDGGGS